jgi:hypothetical protein
MHDDRGRSALRVGARCLRGAAALGLAAALATLALPAAPVAAAWLELYRPPEWLRLRPEQAAAAVVWLLRGAGAGAGLLYAAGLVVSALGARGPARALALAALLLGLGVLPALAGPRRWPPWWPGPGPVPGANVTACLTAAAAVVCVGLLLRRAARDLGDAALGQRFVAFVAVALGLPALGVGMIGLVFAAASRERMQSPYPPVYTADDLAGVARGLGYFLLIYAVPLLAWAWRLLGRLIDRGGRPDEASLGEAA